MSISCLRQIHSLTHMSKQIIKWEKPVDRSYLRQIVATCNYANFHTRTECCLLYDHYVVCNLHAQNKLIHFIILVCHHLPLCLHVGGPDSADDCSDQF